MYYIKSIRPINLLIIAITQCIIYFLVFKPAFLNASLSSSLSDTQLFLIIIDTILIAACGNVVNDIFDEENDRLNHKIKAAFSRSKAINWFFSLFILAIGIAVYLSYQIGKPNLSSIALIAIALLVIYSKLLQKLPLIGNFVVSLFVAFVTGIIWYANKDLYANLAEIDPDGFKRLTIIVASYMVFSFVANMFREIIKDIEDVKGDAQSNYKTMPIVMGVQKSKLVAVSYGLFLIILELVWGFTNPIDQSFFELLLFFICIIFPGLYAVNSAMKARSILDFRKTSTFIKGLMGSALLYLLIIQLYFHYI